MPFGSDGLPDKSLSLVCALGYRLPRSVFRPQARLVSPRIELELLHALASVLADRRDAWRNLNQPRFPAGRVRATNDSTSAQTSSSPELAMQQGTGNRQ